MDWENSCFIDKATLEQNEENDSLALFCHAPMAAPLIRKLMDGATQAALDFDGGLLEGRPVIAFRLQNANGQAYLALQKNDWKLLDEQPDEIKLAYGQGEEEGHHRFIFFNRMFDQFIESLIEKYNNGDRDPFVVEIVSVFAEEE